MGTLSDLSDGHLFPLKVAPRFTCNIHGGFKLTPLAWVAKNVSKIIFSGMFSGVEMTFDGEGWKSFLTIIH